MHNACVIILLVGITSLLSIYWKERDLMRFSFYFYFNLANIYPLFLSNFFESLHTMLDTQLTRINCTYRKCNYYDVRETKWLVPTWCCDLLIFGGWCIILSSTLIKLLCINEEQSVLLIAEALDAGLEKGVKFWSCELV